MQFQLFFPVFACWGLRVWAQDRRGAGSCVCWVKGCPNAKVELSLAAHPISSLPGAGALKAAS